MNKEEEQAGVCPTNSTCNSGKRYSTEGLERIIPTSA